MTKLSDFFLCLHLCFFADILVIDTNLNLYLYIVIFTDVVMISHLNTKTWGKNILSQGYTGKIHTFTILHMACGRVDVHYILSKLMLYFKFPDSQKIYLPTKLVFASLDLNFILAISTKYS